MVVMGCVGRLVGPIRRDYQPAQTGDVADTLGSLDRAAADLGYRPQVPWQEGLAAEVEWARQLYGPAGG